MQRTLRGGRHERRKGTTDEDTRVDIELHLQWGGEGVHTMYIPPCKAAALYPNLERQYGNDTHC